MDDETTTEHGHSHDTEDTSESSILVAKIVTMCALGLVSMCVGLLPILLARWFKWTSNEMSPRSARIIELLLGLGGGVLLSTTFLHILPEVSETIEYLELPEMSVTWAELLMCLGFFLMYFVEEVVHIYIKKSDKSTDKIPGGYDSTKDVNKSTNELVENGAQRHAENEHRHGYGHGHSHMPIPSNGDSLSNSLRGLLIVLGLSIHELFEGLAVGLSTTAQDVWYLFGAVAAHKFVLAFCIGVELIAARTKFWLTVVYICTYSLVSPLGIGIAMILTTGASSPAANTVNVVLQGLAAGTLLYVVFFEILRKQRHGLLQYLAVVVGFLIMFTIQMTTSHSHGHGHGHSHGHGKSHGHSHEGIDHHDPDHDDHDHHHDVISTTISSITEKVVDVVSTTLASTKATQRST